MGELRRLERGFRLWDVGNVEAHVRATLDATLETAGARLNAAQHQRAFAFLLAKCWELSGLEADGSTLRYVFEIRGFLVPRRLGEEFEPIRLKPFPKRPPAEQTLERITLLRAVCFGRVEEARPRGAYDPEHGISFSTYSRRILSKRVWDWYRSDPEFGDSRYESRRSREESLEALGERRQHTDDHEASFLERHSPGSRLDFADELNPYAYQDALDQFREVDDVLEEVLDAALGC